ncbi:MAG: response regulator transcription factor [Lentimicrobiaceae bacterium]|nr:response regulator transcription factor [Lentimicrobiaceae bacterium]
MKVNKIIIVEPSPIIYAGLSDFINTINQISVVSVLDNIDLLNDKMLVHNPDILIINPIVLGFTNNSFIKNISQNYPKTLLVALVSTYVDRNVLRYFKETIELSDTKQKVITKLINLINNNEDTSAQSENIELSNREIDVLICIAKGMTNKDISDRLNISVHTVITHRKNIIRKTGIKSVSGLTVYALLNNWVEESEIYE